MFSGIIESIGNVVDLKQEKGNLHISIQAPFTNELKIDQSIAHNGACLTVVSIQNDVYLVTAIDETLKKTNLGTLQIGDSINLERCMKLGDRLDGHIVQGHVDQVATCISALETNGSWMYTFKYDAAFKNITVEKGSICVNGVSLTVVNSQSDSFSVCIIPYTFENTNFHNIKQGTIVNLEFDILGKYISKLMTK
ncbi:MAG TPA: riboflavin synthase [Bacteroidia bacterium]|jgi:riboflavin synthase|nr:riboflavin synthase [Bacteroidia bacterium]